MCGLFARFLSLEDLRVSAACRIRNWILYTIYQFIYKF